MSLNVMPQDHKFSLAEVEWLKARGRFDEIEENRQKFAAPPEPKPKAAHTSSEG